VEISCLVAVVERWFRKVVGGDWWGWRGKIGACSVCVAESTFKGEKAWHWGGKEGETEIRMCGIMKSGNYFETLVRGRS